MAKIIDLKTRQVLADLPSEKTPRAVRGYRIAEGELQGKLGIIAKTDAQALQIFANVQNQTSKRKAA